MLVFDSVQALKTVDGDTKLLGNLLRLFVEEHEQLLSAVRESIAANDAEQVMFSAHRLKGALRTLGANRASDFAERLELRGRERQLDNVQSCFDSLENETRQFVRTIADFSE
ncbi:MAG: Hpt domain-containing protein [Candidatus Zixiibacteriota bacterium]